MKKVMLICDDYSDLTNMQVELKKLGFDVFGVSNESRFNDNLISFNPDVVVAQGDSHLVSSISVGRKLHENLRYLGKVILIFRPGYKPSAAELAHLRMDMILEQPVDRERLVLALAKLLKLDANAILAKYSKVKVLDPPSQPKRQTVPPVASPFEDKGRAKRYEKFLNLKIDPAQSSHSRLGVREVQKSLQKRWDFKFLESLDVLRREFTRALFKKSN